MHQDNLQANNGNSILKSIFSLFCSSDPIRISLTNPFAIDDFTYATDAHALVRCKSDKIDFDYKSEGIPPSADKIIPQPNTSEIINIDSVDWAALMTEDETINDNNDVVCGNCNGEGTLGDNLSYKGKFYDFEYQCPVCEGAGFEEMSKQIPTGNKTFKEMDMVKLKDIYFYARNLYRLKKVKDLIGGEVELVYHQGPYKAAMFKVSFLEIVIMPCHAQDDEYVVAQIQ